MASAAVYAIATADTKGAELDFVAAEIRRVFPAVRTVDVGTAGPPQVATDVMREAVARCHPQGSSAVLGLTDRGQAVAAMSVALEQWLTAELVAGRVTAVIGLGGSGGTALIAPALRALPVGLPKLLVSTVASGNTAPYVGCTDLTLMYSVVDVAGLNTVSRQVLGNAAAAIAGMAAQCAGGAASKTSRAAVGLTMFGVTTPCVTAVRERLERAGFDPLVFHATGTGGQAMEKLAASGLLGGVLDITTTEVADEVVGGVFPAGPARMDVILARRLPYVLSLGALDMVNFGARDTVPQSFRNRRLHSHNPQVTLMRTTAEECRQTARWIAGKLRRATSPVVMLLPEGGVSALDAPGQPFWDPEADEALRLTLEAGLANHPWVRTERVPYHLNDPAMANLLADRFLALIGSVSVPS